MAGFVDVSNMSDLEIKRMGQRDDDFGYVDQPRGRRTYARPASIKYSVSDVWAAACAAQRINGGYHKADVYDPNRPLSAGPTVRRNRDVMMEFLANPHQLLVEDVEAGERVRRYLQNDLTFRAVKGRLTEFDSAVSRCVAVQEHFDTNQHKYELAVVASLPASAARGEQRQNTDQRMKFAAGGLIGQPGDKISTNVEVVSCNYSKEYNIFWVRGITDQDQPVMFSLKEKFDAGTWLTVQGKVKAHRDNLTQLNYVKVL